MGLDVHACETQAAVLDQATGELTYRKIRGRPREVIDFLEAVPGPFRAVYEAGPTGYGLARRADQAELDVRVCAPGHILKRPQDRIKTDKRDAAKLARLLLAGELRAVRVPSVEEEQLRDLVRAREDVRVDLMRSRHRISKLLLRREVYYPRKGKAWTKRHRGWLATLRFDDRASEVVFADYLEAQDILVSRRDRLERELSELVPSTPWAETIARLRCLRGIDTSLGHRPLRRGRRLPPLRARAAGELSRARSLRGLVGARAPSAPDHQGGLKARPPAPGRGGVALPPPAPRLRVSSPAPGRLRSACDRDRVAGAAAPSPALARPGRTARQAQDQGRDRRCSRALGLLSGGGASGLSPGPGHGWRGGTGEGPRARWARD